jgi:aquaporin Z
MKKYIAEVFGTAVLVFVGCGSVAIAGYGGTMPMGVLPIALAFGLSVTAMAYCIGPVSGCHINPAVTAAVWSAGRMKTTDAIAYMIAQVLGAFVGAGLLVVILKGKIAGYDVPTLGLGHTMFDPKVYSVQSAFLVEFLATLIFTAVILGVTQTNGGGGALAGLIIGLTLVLVHITFVAATGSSVNPARTIASNIYVGGQAAQQIWLYIAAPLLGGLVSGLLFRAKILSSDA